MCDTDILLGGFGLFGGRGEYYGRIKVKFTVTVPQKLSVSTSLYE